MPNFGFSDARTKAELLLSPKRPASRFTTNLSALKINIGGTATPGTITSPSQVVGGLRNQLKNAIANKTAVSGIIASVTKVLASFDSHATAMTGGIYTPGNLIGVKSDSFPDTSEFLQFSSLTPGQPVPTSFKTFITQRKQQLQQMSGSLSAILTKSGISNGLSLIENLQPSAYPLDDEVDLPTIPRLAQGGAVALADSALKDKVRFVVRGVTIGTGKPASWSRLLSAGAIKAVPGLNSTVNQIFRDRKNSSTWSEPVSPYAAQFPYNRVQQTESGHIMEFDDTPGAERVHLFHRAGSFIEMHPDGTVVYKNLKDGYDLTMGSKYVKVSGSCHISVDGNVSLHAKGAVDLQADSDFNAQVKGDFNVFAKNINLRAKKTFKADGTKINLRYINLPSGIVPVPFTGMFAPRVNLAAVKMDFPGGNFDAVSKAFNKTPLDPKKVPSLDLNPPDAPQEPPETPLSNMSVYQQQSPEAAAYRARLFDTPEEVNDFGMFSAHLSLQHTLKDRSPERPLNGRLTSVTTTIEENPTPETVYIPFDTFKGKYTYLPTDVISGTSFTYGDLVDIHLHSTIITDISAIVPTVASADGGGFGEDTPGEWTQNEPIEDFIRRNWEIGYGSKPVDVAYWTGIMLRNNPNDVDYWSKRLQGWQAEGDDAPTQGPFAV